MMDTNALLVISLFQRTQCLLLMFPLMDEDLDVLTELNGLNLSLGAICSFSFSVCHFAKYGGFVCTKIIDELCCQMFLEAFVPC